MRKTLRSGTLLLFLIALIPSCELLEDCKKCTLVTDNDGVLSYGSSGTYCGDKLAALETEIPVTVGSTTKYWECK